MPQVPQQEVEPGLVVHLDTTELRRIGGSETNAVKDQNGDRSVQGPHYFLILEVVGSQCTAVPLFSRKTPGAGRLDDAKKTGLQDKWIGQYSYFNRWQHWKIPLAAVEAASTDEESTPGNRRRYAQGNIAAMAPILDWQQKNRAAYRAA